MHSGRKRTFAASPQIKKYNETKKSFLSLLMACKLSKKHCLIAIIKGRKVMNMNTTDGHVSHLFQTTRLRKYLHHFM